MKKLITAMLSTVLVSGAYAETFDVSVSVATNVNNLVATRVQSLSFPPLLVNESSKVGDTCHTSYSSITYPTLNKLCHLDTADAAKSLGKIEISGSAYTTVNVAIVNDVEKNGLSLRVANSTGANLVLDENGDSFFDIYGVVKLETIEDVKDGPTDFTYTVNLSYI